MKQCDLLLEFHLYLTFPMKRVIMTLINQFSDRHVFQFDDTYVKPVRMLRSDDFPAPAMIVRMELL